MEHFREKCPAQTCVRPALQNMPWRSLPCGHSVPGAHRTPYAPNYTACDTGSPHCTGTRIIKTCSHSVPGASPFTGGIQYNFAPPSHSPADIPQAAACGTLQNTGSGIRGRARPSRTHSHRILPGSLQRYKTQPPRAARRNPAANPPAAEQKRERLSRSGRRA